MIRPATKHTIEILGGAVGVLAIAGVTLAVLLARGPISLGFLTPSISRLMSDAAGEYSVSISRAEIFWARDKGGLELRMSGVEFEGTGGESAAFIPQLDIGVSSAGLREGRFSPTRVSVVEADVTLHRDRTGQIFIGQPGLGADPAPADIPSAGPGKSALPVILNWFTRRDPSGPAAYLNEIEIKQARLRFIDDRTGITIEAPQSQLVLARTKGGIHGDLQAKASIGSEEFELDADIAVDDTAEGGRADLRFSAVNVSHLAPLSPFFEPFAVFDLPVSGVASIELGEHGLVRQAQISLKGEPGRFVFKGEGAPALDIDSTSVNAVYYPTTGHVDLEWFTFDGPSGHGTLSAKGQFTLTETAPLTARSATLDVYAQNVSLSVPELFDGPFDMPMLAATADMTFGEDWRFELKGLRTQLAQGVVALTGKAQAGEGSPAIALDGYVSNFEAADLARVWPKSVMVPAREWVVDHVHSGLLTQGVLTVRAPAGAFGSKPPPNGAVDFVFDVENGVASYVNGLPPLSNVSARMHLTAQTFNLDLNHANILGTDVTSGSVAMNALGVKGAPISIAAAGAGPVEDILKIIDAEPLGFITDFGAKPADFGGNADLTFAMTIPQQSVITAEDIKFEVLGKGRDVKLPEFLGRELSGGSVDLRVTEMGLKGTGDIEINGVPADLTYEEKFRNRGETPSSYRLSATFDDGARAAVGFDTGDVMVGALPVTLTAKGKGAKISEFDVAADFIGVRIDLPEVSLAKSLGAPLKAHIAGKVGRDGAIDLTTLSASGADIAVKGEARLAASGKLMSAEFAKMQVPGLIDATLKIGRMPNDGLDMRIAGDYLNAAPLLKKAMERSGGGQAPDWRLSVQLAEVDLRKRVAASDIVLDAESKGGAMTAVDAKGRFDDGGDFLALLVERADGTRKLGVKSGNAGELVAGLTGIQAVRKGSLNLSLNLKTRGQIETAASASPATAPEAEPGLKVLPPPAPEKLKGQLTIYDFTVVDLPVLARLLNIGSLQGMSDLLQGEGITFSRLDMPFWLEGPDLGIEDGRASGQALGLTVQGVVDRERQVADLRGSIVPAYMLNSVLGHVPVVGQLLISRKGEGIIGFTYGVEGALAEPRLVVNPLSALAPGFLRRLFEMEEAEARNDGAAPQAQ